MLVNAKYPHLLVYSFADHNSNLFFGDIMKVNTFKDVSESKKKKNGQRS